MSQLQDIVNHKEKIIKGALWNFTQTFEAIQRKKCILPGVKDLTILDILQLWHLKSSWDGPQAPGSTTRGRMNCIDSSLIMWNFILNISRFSSLSKNNEFHVLFLNSQCDLKQTYRKNDIIIYVVISTDYGIYLHALLWAPGPRIFSE